MNRLHKTVAVVAIVVLGIACMAAGYAGAGDSTDPLITLSYLEQRLDGIESGGTAGEAPIFTVIQVFEGSTIELGASTEMILRSGRAKAIGSERGGLADVTSGNDLQSGDSVPTNHLLIAPLGDGRGMRFESEAWIMVKGSHRINE